MDLDDYGLDVLDADADVDEDEYEEEDGYDLSDADEVDDMLDTLMSEDLDEDDLAERRRRRRGRGRKRGRARRRTVKTARGRSAYRAPVPKAYVTQKQFKDALARVGGDVKRNASGIKVVNSRAGKLDSRVDGVVSANKTQSREIGKVQRLLKLDGALDFAESVSFVNDNLEVNPYYLLRGAVKSGMLGDTKGALGNPFVVGGIGLVLNRPEILRGVLGQQPE